MRWIDVDLLEVERLRAAAPWLAAAAARAAALPALQETTGIDDPLVTREMAAIGQVLFRAVTAADPHAFSPERGRGGAVDPRIGMTEADHVCGYHLVVRDDDLALPWTWLHNGIGFLLEHHALAAGTTPTWGALAAPDRPWLSRHRDAVLGELAEGSRPLSRLIERLRPAEAGAAQILFLAGHGDAEVWPLLYREADAIGGALASTALGRPLARLHVPANAVTPGSLTQARWAWQGFHFAAPTARPPAAPVEEPWQALADSGWFDAAHAAGEAGPAPLEEEVGELEYAGVDPISALLDELSVRADRRAAPAAPPPSDGDAPAAARPREPAGGARWLLEDGPLRPEELAGREAAPPLVFSNSYLSLPGLGARFLAAGASTFVGPVAAVRSGPAREFAARFYGCLADGYGAAAALRCAALACREQLGAEHPAWLSYGLIGHGSLALQYL